MLNLCSSFSTNCLLLLIFYFPLKTAGAKKWDYSGNLDVPSIEILFIVFIKTQLNGEKMLTFVTVERNKVQSTL